MPKLAATTPFTCASLEIEIVLTFLPTGVSKTLTSSSGSKKSSPVSRLLAF